MYLAMMTLSEFILFITVSYLIILILAILVFFQLIINKYKDTAFYLLDTGETYHVDDGGIQFLRGQSGGWTI